MNTLSFLSIFIATAISATATTGVLIFAATYIIRKEMDKQNEYIRENTETVNRYAKLQADLLTRDSADSLNFGGLLKSRKSSRDPQGNA